jgi:hypothetical protein
VKVRTPGDVVARGTRSVIRAYGRGVVIKVPEPSTPESWIVAEAEHAQAARHSGAPVPRFLEMDQVAGRAASVWEHVRGPSLWQHIVDRPGRTPPQRARRPGHQLPSQRDRLTTKIRRAAATIDPEHAKALELLPAQRIPGRLCHGDLHPSNIIMSENGPMIVDWFDASRGDPIADVARSCVLLLADGAEVPAHLPGADRAALERLTSSYVDRMREHRDIPPDLLARWQAVNAVARMAEGVPRGLLVDVWTRFQNGAGLHAATG